MSGYGYGFPPEALLPLVLVLVAVFLIQVGRRAYNKYLDAKDNNAKRYYSLLNRVAALENSRKILVLDPQGACGVYASQETLIMALAEHVGVEFVAQLSTEKVTVSKKKGEER